MGQNASQIQTQITINQTQYRHVCRKSVSHLADRVELYADQGEEIAMTNVLLGGADGQAIYKYYKMREKVSHVNVVSVRRSQVLDQQGRPIGLGLKNSQVGSKTNVNTFCSLPLFESACHRTIHPPSSKPTFTLSLLSQYHTRTLEVQIEHMSNLNKHYSESELLSFAQTVAEAALVLIRQGFKEPLLSPIGIKITRQGQLKIGQWELVHYFEDEQQEEDTNFIEEGQAFVQPTYTDRQQETHKRPQYSVLTHYYWPPEGTSAIQSTMTPGKLPSQCNNSQIFSLGMTILQMIMQRPLYQKETYSEKTLKKYVKEAVKQREEQKMALSSELVKLIEKMIAWDVEDRISYSELTQQVDKIKQETSCSQGQDNHQGEQNGYLAQSSKSVVIHNDTGSIDQGQGDFSHPMAETITHFLSTPRYKTDTSLDYQKLEYTISRQRKEWELFENRLHQNSTKVLESLEMFKQTFTQGSPAENLIIDDEDLPNCEELVGKGSPNEQKQKIDEDEPEVFSEITNSIKLLDISNIKAVRSVASQKNKQLCSNPMESFSLNLRSPDSAQNSISLNMGKNVNGFLNQSESLLLMTSKSPPQPPKQSQDDLFTSPELMAYIRDSIIRKERPSSHRNTKLEISPSARQKVASPSCVKEELAQGWYEGCKVDGLRSGYGTFYYREGGKYCGDWYNGQMHGRGTLYYSDGRIAYQGQWRCDSLSGQGILYNEHPQRLTSSYDFKDFDLSQECWVSYQGQFLNDDKHGEGILTLSNGQRFEGYFKNDLVNGAGTFYNMEGDAIHGIWQKNQLVSLRMSGN